MESSAKSTTPSLSAEDFLRTILRSGLLDREALQSHLGQLAPEQRVDPSAIADHLIKNGRLTPFQARRLLRGSSKGLLFGNYEILAAIGRGGMSVVYLARDRRSGQLIALKVLPPEKARNEGRMLARFQREMELCQKVSHSHIAWTYEVGVLDGIYFIAMEYIPGHSLHRLVVKDGPLSASRAAHLLGEVAQGLDHAHQQGLIHRDMKPANIMVTPSNHAKVLDLGFALMEGEVGDVEVVGGQGYVVGTMDYIAPEQVDDPTKVDARTDVYALGCTLYFALCGQPPFPGGTSREKMKRHRREKPRSLLEINPGIPPEMARVVLKMMAKKPENRFESADAVSVALTPWASNEQFSKQDVLGDLTLEHVMSQQSTESKEAEEADRELFQSTEEKEGSDQFPTPPPEIYPAKKRSRKAVRPVVIEEQEPLPSGEVLDLSQVLERVPYRRSFWERPEVFLGLGALGILLILLLLSLILS